MSANATLLRAVLRSIGSHAVPNPYFAPLPNQLSRRRDGHLRKSSSRGYATDGERPWNTPRLATCYSADASVEKSLGQAARDGKAIVEASQDETSRGRVKPGQEEERGTGRCATGASRLGASGHATYEQPQSQLDGSLGAPGHKIEKEDSTLVTRKEPPAPDPMRLSPEDFPLSTKATIEQTPRVRVVQANRHRLQKSHDNATLPTRFRYVDHVQTQQASAARRSRTRVGRVVSRHKYAPKASFEAILLNLMHQRKFGEGEYVKYMEEVQLPAGTYAKWRRNPAESILEIKQRTGSHMQVIPGEEDDRFRSAVLYGALSQNAAAKRLIRGSHMLRAVEGADSDTSSNSALSLESRVINPKELMKNDLPAGVARELADLLSEVTGEAPETSPVVDPEEDGLDGSHAIRASWSEPPRTRFDEDLEVSPDGKLRIPTNVCADSASSGAVTLARRIEELTRWTPRRLVGKRSDTQDHTAVVRDHMVELLVDPVNAANISAEIVRLSLGYLVRHAYYPEARQITNALTKARVHMTADMFEPLFQEAVRAENVYAFQYLAQTLNKQQIRPSAAIWTSFYVLTLKHAPQYERRVLKKMSRIGVFDDLSAKIHVMEQNAAKHIERFLEVHPTATIREYIDDTTERNPGVFWLTRFYAHEVIKYLLTQGKIEMAYDMVTELVQNGEAPTTRILNLFISVAYASRDLGAAVSALRRFRQIHYRPPQRRGTDAKDFENGASRIAVAANDEGGSVHQEVTDGTSIFSPSQVHAGDHHLLLSEEKEGTTATEISCNDSAPARTSDNSTADEDATPNTAESGSATDDPPTDDTIVRSSPEPNDPRTPTPRRIGNAFKVPLDAETFKPMIYVAASRKQWNCFRVLWRYGCVSGVLNSELIHKLKADSAYVSARLIPQMTRGHLWRARAIEFAAGVDKPWSRPTEGPWRKETNERGQEVMVTAKGLRRAMLDQLAQDTQQVNKLRPTKPFVVAMEEALALDSNWKTRFLGLPKGLEADKFGPKMFEAMKEEGIEVDFVEGDGRRLIA